MMKRSVAVLLAAVSVLSLALFSSCTTKKQFSKTDVTVFDTQTVILGWETDENLFEKRADAILDRLSELHSFYDIYHEYEGINNIKTVNDNAGLAPVSVSEEIIDLILYCKEIYELTDGRTNVAMGSVLSIWHDYRERGIEDPDKASLPTIEELSMAAEHTDINKVIVDEKANTLYLEDSDMSLDVGAVAKGYAVELVATELESEGASGYALSVGGNVRCIGEKANGDPWEIGVQNPDLSSSQAYFAKVYLTDESLVTSGSYQRFYTVAKKNYHHIIDPQTLFPKDEYASVSVISRDSGLGDALSTALFNMSYEEGSALAEKENVEAAWVYPDGSIKMTDGFEELTKQGTRID